MNPEKKEPKDLTTGIFYVMLGTFVFILRATGYHLRYVYVHVCACIYVCER